MPDRHSPRISVRKQPQQARSAAAVAAILDAAVQVLAAGGAGRFTTARVAERAGVSVGTLYQYFPNKAAILFRLQADEWARTAGLLLSILADVAVPPAARLRALVHAFVRSECEEAALRVALADAAPLYRDAPEARAARAAGDAPFRAFVDAALPAVAPAAREVAAGLIGATLGKMGKHLSETAASAAEAEPHADALAGMLCAYLESLAAAGAAG